MMINTYHRFICSLLMTLFLICTVLPTIGEATFIDFEGLGVAEGDPVPTIDGVTFDADIVIQGSPTYAFSGTAFFADGGDSAPFSNLGNVFIVNTGGYVTPETTKQVTIQFPTEITNLSFLVADVDRDVPDTVIEQVNAEVFDGSNASLGIMTVDSAPTDSTGDVVLVDFGSLSGIKSLVVELSNIGTDTGFTALGFGIDNLSFTVAVVPEPSSLMLLSLGLLALVRRRRSK